MKQNIRSWLQILSVPSYFVYNGIYWVKGNFKEYNFSRVYIDLFTFFNKIDYVWL